jgi:uncharacterized protein YeaO (DUF488 family)
MIQLKRVYDEPSPRDGMRILVDRLWPRGVAKADAHLDAWEKAIAPSATLREWYQHDVAKWPEFQRRYERELQAPASRAVLDDLARRARRGRVTLVYASRDADISDVAVIERLLRDRVKAARRPHSASTAKSRRSASPTDHA